MSRAWSTLYTAAFNKKSNCEKDQVSSLGPSSYSCPPKKSSDKPQLWVLPPDPPDLCLAKTRQIQATVPAKEWRETGPAGPWDPRWETGTGKGHEVIPREIKSSPDFSDNGSVQARGQHPKQQPGGGVCHRAKCAYLGTPPQLPHFSPHPKLLHSKMFIRKN